MRARKEMLLCAFLVFLGSRLGEGSDLLVQCATDVILGRLGSSVVLPCWLTPPLDVEDMEIRWYRPNQYSNPVLLYISRIIVPDQQEERYRNRTSLSLREEHSAGLKGGDVSLRLENLTLADRGAFHCFVSGDSAYGSGKLTLNITALGSSPVLSLRPQGDLVNVTCTSCGWQPEPRLEWRCDKRTSVRPGGLLFSQDGGELICVHSWVLLSPSYSKWISCSVSLSGGEERDGHVDIQNIVGLEHGEGPWKALFAVSVLAVVALLVIGVYFYRKNRTGYGAVNKDEEAESPARPNTNMAELRKEAVRITLDTSCASQHLKVKENVIRDDQSAAGSHKGPGFPYHLSVCGRNSFSGGRAYWEVTLASRRTPTKTSWLIGVTTESELKDLPANNEFSPSSGFWFLYSDEKTGLHVNSEPEISLPHLTPMPKTIGVFLDYDQGELSFYNAEEGVRLITIKTQFKGRIKPIFNPGIGDKSPLVIPNIPIPS